LSEVRAYLRGALLFSRFTSSYVKTAGNAFGFFASVMLFSWVNAAGISHSAAIMRAKVDLSTARRVCLIGVFRTWLSPLP
jgi:hypothetical protein